MSAPFAGPPRCRSTPRTRRGRPPRATNLRRAREVEAAAQALPALLLDAGSERQHVAAAAGRPRLPARLLPHEKRRLETEQAVPAEGPHRRGMGEAAALLRDGSRQGHGRTVAAGDAVAGRDRRLQVAARRRLRVYSRGIRRTGFQGGLQGYRVGRAAATRRSCSSSPAGRSISRRCSSPAAATGACIRTRAHSSACRRPPARGCSTSTRRRRRALGAAGTTGGDDQAAAGLPGARSRGSEKSGIWNLEFVIDLDRVDEPRNPVKHS